ncbi:MAG: PP2C family protein-serine/threonine phosphatase [Polyangiales bacterium]
MVWIGAAVLAAVAVLVLLRLMGGGDDEPAPAVSPARAGVSKPAPAMGGSGGKDASKTPAAKAALASKPIPDGDEAEGTKVTSERPPATGSHGVIRDLTGEDNGRGEVLRSSGNDVSVEFMDGDDPTGPQALILVTAVGRTDAGRRRKHNEDSYLTLNDHSIFVIADGMGGYAAGEVASQLAVDVISEAFKTNTFTGDIDHSRPARGDELCRAIAMSNTAILTQAQSNEAQHGMGTTVVSCRFSPNKQRVYIAHVGDSRCYRIRGGKIRQMTTDHTLGAAGITGPAAAKLSRAVGIGDVVEVDLTVDAPHAGDHYILCSDGLSKMIPDEMIRDLTLEAGDLDGAVQKLIEVANERGGRDNVTVILIRVDEPVL